LFLQSAKKTDAVTADDVKKTETAPVVVIKDTQDGTKVATKRK
jgi:hypothetical protein